MLAVPLEELSGYDWVVVRDDRGTCLAFVREDAAPKDLVEVAEAVFVLEPLGA